MKADPGVARRHRKRFHKKCIFSEIARRDQSQPVVAKFEEAPLAEIPLSDTSWNDRGDEHFLIYHKLGASSKSFSFERGLLLSTGIMTLLSTELLRILLLIIAPSVQLIHPTRQSFVRSFRLSPNLFAFRPLRPLSISVRFP